MNKYEFGLVSRLNAESLGEPGKRHIPVVGGLPSGFGGAMAGEGTASRVKPIHKAGHWECWEEKGEESPSTLSESGAGNLQVEFNLGKQAIEYDRDAGIFRFLKPCHRI